MSPINGVVIASLLFTLGYMGSLVSFLVDRDAGKCEMTYMFEYPQFVRIPNTIDEVFPKYGLYAYSEGRLTERVRNMYFDGIPVLFIPGSGGSHKQVRSLASIALRKALNSRTVYHFDYFTIDLNKELSGLNGAILEDQLLYAKHSIKTILKLYEDQRRPTNSIIVIGHSMGGIIAKALTANQTTDDLIPIIITLSTPLVRPPIDSDYYLHNFYQKYVKNTTLTQSTTFISIAGGFNDILIPSYLTTGGHLSLVSTCVPKSWISTDHLSILWCKQLVLAINRALFESVDLQTKQISNLHDHRLAVFQHHLIKHAGTKTQHREKYFYPVSMSSEGEWFESINRQYSVRLPKGTRNTKWYMIPLIIQPKHEAITVVTVNMKSREWIYMCPAVTWKGSQRICDVGRHLTHLTEISPSVKYKRRTLRLDMKDAKLNYSTATHVVVRVAPTDEPVILHIDVHSPRERTVIVNDLPKWFTYQKKTVIEMTEEKTIQYQLVLPLLTHLYQSYLLYLEPTDCTGEDSHATASLVVPWDNHDIHGFVTEYDRSPINLRLHSPRPHHMANESAIVRLTLDPTCRYKVSIKNTIQFGNFARFYTPLLVANVAAVVLMTLRSQLKNIDEKERCSMFFTAIKEGAKPYYVVTVVKVLSKMLSIKGVDKLFPITDWHILNTENLDFFLLPLMLYLISAGIVWCMALGLSVSFMFFESTIHKLGLKFITKTFSGGASWTNHIMKTFEKLPGAVALFLLGTSISTSGGLALCLATCFYFLKLTQMAQDFIEDIVKGIVKSIGKKISEKLIIKIKDRWRRYKENKKKRLELKNSPREQIECIEDETISKAESPNDKPLTLKSNMPSTSTQNVESKITEEGDSKEIYTDSEIDEDDVVLEKPMEIEVCAGGDVAKVNGEKLVQLLQNNVGNGTSGEGSKEESAESTAASAQSMFKNLTSKILQEIMENNEIFFHFTIFFLYLIVAMLNVPSVLTWAHNYRYNKRLDPDPAFLPGILLSACALPLWQLEFPKVEKRFYLELSIIVDAAAILCLMYGTLSIYRLSYIISFVVVLITLHQLFAVNKPESEEGPDEDDGDNLEDSYESRVKAKLE